MLILSVLGCARGLLLFMFCGVLSFFLFFVLLFCIVFIYRVLLFSYNSRFRIRMRSRAPQNIMYKVIFLLHQAVIGLGGNRFDHSWRGTSIKSPNRFFLFIIPLVHCIHYYLSIVFIFIYCMLLWVLLLVVSYVVVFAQPTQLCTTAISLTTGCFLSSFLFCLLLFSNTNLFLQE